MERSRDDHAGPTRPARRDPSSVVAVAAAVAWLQLAVEAWSRTVAVSVVPARAAFHLLVVLVALLGVAVAGAARTARQVPGVAGPAVLRLGGSLAAASVVLAGRLVLEPWQPTVLALAPLLVVAPVLTSWELVARIRAGGGRRWRPVEHSLRLWCSLAVPAGVLLGLQPARWGASGPQTGEFRATWVSVLVAGVIAAAGAALARRATAWWFAVVSLAAVGVLVAASGATVSTVPTTVWIAATVAAVGAAGTWVPRDDRGRIVVGGRTSVPVARRLGRRIGLVGGAVAGAGRTAGSATGRHLRNGSGRAARGLGDLVAPPSLQPRPVRTRIDRQLGALVLLGSTAYVVAGAVWAFRIGWQPTGHAATLMARASQVGTADHPWIGLVTSLGGAGSGAAHPGPFPMDVLAPFVRVFGVSGGAIVGGATVTLVCWLVAVWAAWRAAGRSAALAVWVAAAVVIAVPGLGAVWEANNISISMLAMFTTVVLCWAVATGTWSAWWPAVLGACFCAQSYIPHALVVVGPLVVAAATMLVVRRRSTDPVERARIARFWWVGVAAGLLAWAQPAWEAIANDGGNVRALLTEVTTPVPSLGASGMVRALAWIFAVPPRWGEVTESYAQAGGALDFVGGSVVVGLLVAAVVAGAAWWSRRTTPSSLRQLQTVTLAVVVGACLNATQLPMSYLRSFQLGWLVVASIVVWLTVGLRLGVAALHRLRLRSGAAAVRNVARAATGLSLVALVVLGLNGPASIEEMKGTPFAIDAMIDPVVEPTVAAVGTDRPVLALRAGTRLNEVATDTVVSNLIARGVDVRVEPGLGGFNYGRRRLVDRWDGPTIWILGGIEPNRPTGTLVARAEVPGWSDEDVDRTARAVAERLGPDGTVVLQPWVGAYLVRYLSGWVGTERVCALAEELRSGRVRAADLPPGLLLTLYGDLAVESPQLPADLQTAATDLVGRAPLEVWVTDRQGDQSVDSDRMLRDGTQCPPAPGER